MATAMAVSSSSSTPKWTYDVFLSFRGEDTRANFIDHLYTALDDRGIYTFKDDQNLKRGKSISPELIKAIEQSRFSIVVFSRNYADSSWCLDELVKIVDCKILIGQTVLPVFYYVDPSEVRKQTGCFGESFAKHEINGGKDEYQIQRWRDALAEAASIAGWDLSNAANGFESTCIKEIVKYISTILGYNTASILADNLIGMESRVQNVKSQLVTGSNEVQMVGIWGMGGMGKTTLATAIFNDISNQFEGKSFVANVRENLKSGNSLHTLQEKILSDVLMDKKVKVPSIDDGIIMMSRLCHKKVLLVLDDVDHVNQLEALVGKHDWFGKGSRIIITTRDEHLLVAHGVIEKHTIDLLSDDEALILFSRYAFKSNSPPEEYEKLSRRIVCYVGGLPLALKVLGSFLYGRAMVEWKGAVKRLVKHLANKEILDVLKISYDGLECNEQEIFLDIACFFIGMKKDDASEILDSFDFYPDIGLSVLIEKSLVTVSNGTLQMHDLIKEMGLNIVYQMDPKPGGRSRLWSPEDVHVVLTNDTASEAIEGIKLHKTKTNYSFRALENMTKLRLLDVSYYYGYGRFKGPGPKYLSNELRWICWQGYPSKSLPPGFRAEKLVCLNMPWSNLIELWRGKKILDKLKLVDLSESTELARTPDFSGAPHLEKLILCNCVNLKEVHPSLGDLQKLTVLDLSGCIRLKRFLSGFNMTSLEILILSHCLHLQVFPKILGNMKRLTNLFLDLTAIKELHPSIGNLTGLVNLDLSFSENLRCLPSTLGHLKRLKNLNLAGCSRLEELPETLGQMECLEELHVNGTAIRQPPSCIVLLKELKTLSIWGYKHTSFSLSSFFSPLSSRANSSNFVDSFLWQNLSGFLSLKKLEILYCNLSEIPSNLCQLSALEELRLNGNDFTCLPDSLCQLSRLKLLDLKACTKLKALTELPSSLAVLNMDKCESLESAGDLLSSKYEWLHEVSFRNCFKLTENEHHSSRDSVLADMLLRTLLQGRSVINHKFSFWVPGREIPNWISVQVDIEGYTTNRRSLELKLLSDWDRRIAGFAICCVLRIHLRCPITISLGRKYEQVLEHRLWPFQIDSDHVWLGYVSLDLFGQKCFGNNYEKEYDWVGGTEESFLQIGISNLNGAIRKFGIRVVYKEDVKQVIKENDHNSSSESPGNFGFFPTKEGKGHFYFR